MPHSIIACPPFCREAHHTSPPTNKKAAFPYNKEGGFWAGIAQAQMGEGGKALGLFGLFQSASWGGVSPAPFCRNRPEFIMHSFCFLARNSIMIDDYHIVLIATFTNSIEKGSTNQ